MHTVVKTQASEAQRHALGLSDDAFIRIASAVGMAPKAGVSVLGIPGLMLFTVPPIVSGAEADIEVVAFYAGDDIPMFLLDLAYAGEPLSLSARDRAAVAADLSEIAGEYRASQAGKIVKLRKRDGQN